MLVDSIAVVTVQGVLICFDDKLQTAYGSCPSPPYHTQSSHIRKELALLAHEPWCCKLLYLAFWYCQTTPVPRHSN